MKLPLALLATSAVAVSAGDLRKWTQAETKKTLEGTITDKKSDISSAKIITADNRTVWLEAKTLTSEDQDFIRKWVDEDGRLTVRVIVSGRGWLDANPLELPVSCEHSSSTGSAFLPDPYSPPPRADFDP